MDGGGMPGRYNSIVPVDEHCAHFPQVSGHIHVCARRSPRISARNLSSWASRETFAGSRSGSTMDVNGPRKLVNDDNRDLNGDTGVQGPGLDSDAGDDDGDTVEASGGDREDGRCTCTEEDDDEGEAAGG